MRAERRRREEAEEGGGHSDAVWALMKRVSELSEREIPKVEEVLAALKHKLAEAEAQLKAMTAPKSRL